MRPTNFREVIDLWPSVPVLAEELGEKSDTIHKWKARNSIPADKWSLLISRAKARRLRVDAELMTRIAGELVA